MKLEYRDVEPIKVQRHLLRRSQLTFRIHTVIIQGQWHITATVLQDSATAIKAGRIVTTVEPWSSEDITDATDTAAVWVQEWCEKNNYAVEGEIQPERRQGSRPGSPAVQPTEIAGNFTLEVKRPSAGAT
ncbi:hypothetical protein JNJ66_05990 [Candidatus Saccharibacteria bacterium]|nr:hypothetical protein [Candidatus Saccharibacteria bacterium]